jgi:hypothetical protein
MEWYSKFNGKNMGGILIPKVKTTRPKSNTTNKKKQTQRIATLEELGIPLDLNLFNQSIMYSQGDKFSTVAWTTLDNVRREFFNIDKTYTKEDLFKFIKENNIKTKSDLWNKNGNWFKVAKRLGIDMDKILPNKYNKDWNEKRIIEVIKEYNDLTTFYKELPNAYKNAKKLGILDDISKHMTKPVRNTPYNKKDIPDLVKIIKDNECKGRNDVRNILSRNAYDFLNDKGIIQKMFPNKITSNQFMK